MRLQHSDFERIYAGAARGGGGGSGSAPVSIADFMRTRQQSILH